MRRSTRNVALVLLPVIMLLPHSTQALDGMQWIWSSLCLSRTDSGPVRQAAYRVPGTASTSTAPCLPPPSGYHRLQQATSSGDLSVSLAVSSDVAGTTLCYVYNAVPEAPVIRIQRGHRLTVRLTNSIEDGGPGNIQNCLLQTFVDGGACTPPGPMFMATPGPDGLFYPIAANIPHFADGTTNLHVHGMVVSPRPCHDEVLVSTIYPANWGGPIGHLLPCQEAPNELTYRFDVPPDHPEGLYWYHTHRHGQAQAATMLGLVGAIVVEGPDDARRRALGVGDDVFVIGDVPLPDPASNGAAPMPAHTHVLNHRRHVRSAHAPSDPRIDVTNEVTCDPDDPPTGGPQITRLTLNGALVPEGPDGAFPPDDVLLTKTMQPGQTEVWRIANASANTAIRPHLVLVENGVATDVPMVVLARDGVPVADDAGAPFMQTVDTVHHPVLLDPANRLEILVHAPPPGATLYLESGQVVPGCAGDGDPARRLLRIVAAGDPVTPVPDAAVAPADPDMYYTHILDRPASVRRVFGFTEFPRGFTVAHSNWNGPAPQPGDYDPDDTDFFLTMLDSSADPALSPSIKPFDMQSLTPDVVVHLKGAESVTEEWTIQNYALEYHGFHIHQIHFRDITASRSDPAAAPLLDTVNVPPAANVNGIPGAPGEARIRLTFARAQIGEFVLHCHVLEHEDNGMMLKIRVVAD